MSSAEERHVGPTATRLGARHCELKIEDHELKLDVHSHELNRYYVAPTRPLRHRSCRPPLLRVHNHPPSSMPLSTTRSQPVSAVCLSLQLSSSNCFSIPSHYYTSRPCLFTTISWLAPSSLDYALSSAAQLSNATTIFNATPPPLSRPSGKLVKLSHTHDTSTFPSSPVCAYRASSCAALSTDSHLMDWMEGHVCSYQTSGARVMSSGGRRVTHMVRIH